MKSTGRHLALAIALSVAALFGDHGTAWSADDPVRGVRLALEAGHYASAREQARELIEVDPDNHDAWRLFAEVESATGGYREALRAYRRSLALTGEPDLTVEVAAARLEALLGHSGDARQRLQRVIAAGGAGRGVATVAGLIALGDAYRELARLDPRLYREALDSYEAAIRRDPQDPRSHVAMGELLLDRYNNTEALEAFRAALELAPDHLPALMGLAESQHFDHSPAAAETARRCLERRSNFVPARVFLAKLLIDSEEYDAAESHLREALATNPVSPEARTALAAIHLLRGEGERFQTLTDEIGRATPGYRGLFVTLAEVASRNRRYAEAQRFASVAVQLDRNAWRAYALLGQTLLRLGRMEAGRRRLEEAFRGDPYDVRTRNILELLDRLERFEERRSEHFVLAAAPEEADVLAARLLPIAEQAYGFFAERYGNRPHTPIRIEIFPRREDFSVRTVGLVGLDILGVSFGPVIALNSPSSGAFGSFNWASAVWHEIAHSFHLDLTRGRVPRWFTEGLAVYEERLARPGWGMDVSPGFLRAFLEGRLAPASDPNRAFLRPAYPQQIPHAYYQTSLLLEMIEARHGFEAILGMLRGYGAGRTSAELIEEVLGMTTPQFDAAFDAFVRERFQRSLAGLFDGPSSDAETGAPGYLALVAQGRSALQADQLDRALTLLEKAQALFPDHGGKGSAYHLLAQVHERRGDEPAAIAALEASIAIDADDLQGHQELARLYRRQGDTERAAATLERALLIQPFDRGTHRQLAELYEPEQRWEEAVTARRALVALGTTDAAGARYRLARALSEARQPNEARRELLRALEAAPLYEEALELLLVVRAQRGAEPQRPIEEQADE